jgi:CubicO group peptidase (beta-lactamase class C family)
MTTGDQIRPLLESARESHVFSAYQVYTCKTAVREWWGGVTSYWQPSEPIGPTTLFDIGSVTKAVVTATLAALAVDQKKCSLQDTVGRWVPEWRTSPVGALQISDLLCHAAGLKAWLPLFESPIAHAGLRAWVASQGAYWIEAVPGARTAYSDLGFLILGEVLTEVWKTPFQEAFRHEVIGPLALPDVTFGPIAPGTPVVATEVREGKPLQGIVFDENSAALGGITPHAGLFSSARGIAPWCAEWLKATQGKSHWLGETTARLFTRKAERVDGSTWGLGWDTRSYSGSSAGSLFSPASFGHLGFPGCSVWIDPQRGGYAVFWSNRVHPSRLDERIRKFRPKLHDAIAKDW